MLLESWAKLTKIMDSLQIAYFGAWVIFFVTVSMSIKKFEQSDIWLLVKNLQFLPNFQGTW